MLLKGSLLIQTAYFSSLKKTLNQVKPVIQMEVIQSNCTITNSTAQSIWDAYLQDTSTGFWVLKICITMVTIVGNGLVIFLILTRKKLHTTDNWFILSLSLSDLFIGAYITPSELICKLFSLCIRPNEIRSVLPNFLIMCSICNLCALTADRYTAILHPLRYLALMTSKRVKHLVFLAWFAPLAIAGVTVILDMNQYHNTIGSYIIVPWIVLVTFIPSVSLVLVYLRIYIVVLKQRKMVKRQMTMNTSSQSQASETGSRDGKIRSRDRSSIRVLGVVIMFFVLCWQPSIYRAICEHFKVCHVTLAIVQTSRVLILLNSAVNFVVYALLKKDIRREFLLKCTWTFIGRERRYSRTSSSFSVRSAVASTLGTSSTSVRHLDQEIELIALTDEATDKRK